MTLQVLEEWNSWSSTGATIQAGDDKLSFELPGISLYARDSVVRQVESDLQSGMSLRDSIESQRLDTKFNNLPRAKNLAEDLILVDASDRNGVFDAVDLAKSMSSLSRGTRRFLVVSGSLEPSNDSDYNSLGSFGALMVRLNVAYFICVGLASRPLYLSVGLEGSWDGESRFSKNAMAAYDDLRARIEPGDAILVIGGAKDSLSALVGKLEEDS